MPLKLEERYERNKRAFFKQRKRLEKEKSRGRARRMKEWRLPVTETKINKESFVPWVNSAREVDNAILPVTMRKYFTPEYKRGTLLTIYPTYSGKRH